MPSRSGRLATTPAPPKSRRWRAIPSRNISAPRPAASNSAARLVRITEHYVRMDYEGEGRPCLYQVITGGDQGEILRKDGKDCITPFDAMPFARRRRCR